MYYGWDSSHAYEGGKGSFVIMSLLNNKRNHEYSAMERGFTVELMLLYNTRENSMRIKVIK